MSKEHGTSHDAGHGEAHGSAHVLQSLAVNLLIALIKGGAAYITRSGAMAAEALHSSADCGNQLLLLLGLRQAKKRPDAEHPLGYGRSLYFWSFMVALLLFLGGGVVSIHEGVEKLLHPTAVEHPLVAVVVLALSLLLEGSALWSNVIEIHRRRGKAPFFPYLRQSKDTDLIVVFGENAAAVLGLLLALVAIGLAVYTGNGRWDGLGSILIGLVLVAVAFLLAREIQSLLIGEAADGQVERALREAVAEHALIEKVLHVVTVQQGPEEALVAAKVSFRAGVSVEDVCRSINELEAALRERCPQARWCFIEPDIARVA